MVAFKRSAGRLARPNGSAIAAAAAFFLLAAFPPGAVADGAGAKPVYAKQPIFQMQRLRNHSPGLVELGDGSLLACWFNGSGEQRADDVQILGSWLVPSATGSAAWSPPFQLADTPGFPDCNPALFFGRDGALWLMWAVIKANDWGSSIIKYRKAEPGAAPPDIHWEWQDILHVHPPHFRGEYLSEALSVPLDLWSFIPKIRAEVEYNRLYDNIALTLLGVVLLASAAALALKRRWIPKKSLLAVPALALFLGAAGFHALFQTLGDKYSTRLGWMVQCKPLLTHEGTLLVPLYSDTFSMSLIARTEDNGRTWSFGEPLIGIGNIQPALIQKEDGTIVALMRDNGPYGRIRTASSRDGGKTWSEVTSTELRNPGSSIDVLKLRNGRWVLIHNDLMKGRHRLLASISDDEGKTWKWRRYLERTEPYEADYHYPTAIQTRDGMIHCVYSQHYPDGRSTILHASFNEAWVQAGGGSAADSNSG